jgi:phage/plasmid primase-like uncharacterized protein
MLQWLTDNVSVFKIQHNAHREFHMSVEQHLQHRQRIGERTMFVTPLDRDACIARGQIWELRVILHDGTSHDIAGSTLHNCIGAIRQKIADAPATTTALAA